MQRRDPFAPTYKYKYKKVRDWIILCALITLSVLIFLIIKLTKANYCIYVNETPITCLKERKEAEEVINRILIKHASYLKEKAKFKEKVEIKKDRKLGRGLIDNKEIAQTKLEPYLNVVIEATAIKVDDKNVVIVKNEKAAKLVLDRIKKELLPPEEKLTKLKNIRFKQEVETEKIDAKFNEIKNVEKAIKILKRGIGEVTYHRVKKGETGWTIARKYNLSLTELKLLNPNINLDRLHIDDKLNVSRRSKKVISVLAEKIVIKKRNEPFTTKTIYNRRWEKDRREIIREGRNGVVEEKILIKYENGVPVERKIIEKRIVKRPSQRIVMVGIREND